MKKIALITIALLLIGCIEDNPFRADPDVGSGGGNAHPHVTMAGTESGGPGSIQLSDLDPETAGIQDAIIIEFDKDMDPATITASSFQMVQTDPGSGSVAFESVDYYQETRTAVLSGTFTDDTAYLLTIPAGRVLDIAGKELDPNRNAVYDGSPWDDRLFVFVAGTAEVQDITSPVPVNQSPTGGGLSDRMPEISVSFFDGPMDLGGLTLNNFTLVRTSDSSSVPLELVNADPANITAVPVDSLAYGTRYTVRLSAGIADSSGNLLDSNGDGFVWPDEPDFVWDFQMEDDSLTSSTPPTLAEAALLPGNLTVRIEFEESLTGDFVEMDENTFTAATIQAMDALGSIPLSFETGADPSAVNCLLQRHPQGTVTLFISCYVADIDGNLFDGNNDGLGGTPEEDDWWGNL